MKVLSPEETRLFLQAAKEDCWGIIFSLTISTGMRPEEYLELRWKKVDLTKSTVTIERGLVDKRKGGG